MTAHDSMVEEVARLMRSGAIRAPQPRSPVSDVELDAVERELGVALPPSYRTFVKLCGTGRVGMVDVFGLPRNDLWGDIVVMNQLAGSASPRSLLKFASDWTGRAYYFDLASKSPDCEWPVAVLDAEAAPRVVASSFLEFLASLVQGPITVELHAGAH